MRIQGLGIDPDAYRAAPPAPPAAHAPLPPTGALDPSQANTLDVTTTDPSAYTRAAINNFFQNPTPPPDTPDPTATDYAPLYWLAAGLAAVYVLGQSLGGGR